MEENKNFEESLQELECIVKELESGNVNLDDAINRYTSYEIRLNIVEKN